ncbi:MAG: LamG domain-containing protein [Proteobacteria bacterium]|nr:LamG domain-containing protein [Pseudomonadota bacterium]
MAERDRDNPGSHFMISENIDLRVGVGRNVMAAPVGPGFNKGEPMIRPRNEKGFSLLLVVLILAGLTVLAIGGGKLALSLRAYQKQSRVITDLNKIRNAALLYYQGHRKLPDPLLGTTYGVPVGEAELDLNTKYKLDTWGQPVHYNRVPSGLTTNITGLTVNGKNVAGVLVSGGADQQIAASTWSSVTPTVYNRTSDDIVVAINVASEAEEFTHNELQVLNKRVCSYICSGNDIEDLNPSKFPSGLDNDTLDFIAGIYGLSDSDKTDPWGNKYVWDHVATRFYSYGPNGLNNNGNPDDVISPAFHLVGCCPSATSNMPVTDGLVGFWNFDNMTTTTAVGATGSNHGALGSGVTWNALGRIGGGLSFNGTGGVNAGNNSSLELGNSMTLMAWIKRDEAYLSGYRAIIVKRSTTTVNDSEYQIYMGPDEQVEFWVQDGGWWSFKSAGRIQDTQWHHVAFVWNGTTAWMYIDGLLDNTGAFSHTVPYSGNNLYIGWDVQYANRGWRGEIDEVAIFNRILNSCEVRSVYNVPCHDGCEALAFWPLDSHPYDKSGFSKTGNGYSGSIVGALPGQDRFGCDYMSMSFSGSGDRIETAFNPKTDVNFGDNHPFTVAMWLYPTSVSGTPWRLPFGSWRPGNLRFYFGAEAAGHWLWGYGDASNTLTVGPTANAWQFVAWTFDGSYVKFYVGDNSGNITLLDDFDFTGHTGTVPDAQVWLGARNSPTAQAWFIGRMDDVVVYNRGLNCAEIMQLYKLATPAACLPSGNRVLWLKADAGVTHSGGAISQWNDQSGAGANAAQATVAEQPTWVEDGPNHKPVVRFDGTNDWLKITNFAGLTNQNAYSILMNGSCEASGLPRDILGGMDPATYPPAATTHGLLLEVLTGNNVRLLHRFPFAAGGGDNLQTTSGGFSYATPLNLALVRSATNMNAWINGSLQSPAQATTTAAFNLNMDVAVGRLSPAQTIRYLYGGIAELLVFNKALSDSERSRCESYLDWKYSGNENVSLPPGVTLWLRASTGVEEAAGDPAENGDSVYDWLDQSGQEQNANRGAAGAEPVYVTNAIKSFWPVVRFNGTNQWLRIDNFLGLVNKNEYTLFIVGSVGGPDQDFLGCARGTNHGILIEAEAAANQLRFLHREPFGGGAGDNLVTTGGNLSYGQVQILSFMRSGSEQAVWFNTLNKESIVPATNALPLGFDMAIGKLSVSQNMRYLNGDIAEIILFNRALSTSERRFVESYLYRKYLM